MFKGESPLLSLEVGSLGMLFGELKEDVRVGASNGKRQGGRPLVVQGLQRVSSPQLPDTPTHAPSG